MALVRETGFEGHLRERNIALELDSRPFEPQAARVLANRHAEFLAERSGEMTGMNACFGGELGECWSVWSSRAQGLDDAREPVSPPLGGG